MTKFQCAHFALSGDSTKTVGVVWFTLLQVQGNAALWHVFLSV